MELAIGALTNLFGGTVAAGTAAAAGATTATAAAGTAAGATAAGAASGLSTALTILEGAATVAGMLAMIGSGKAEADSYKMQARTANMEAKNEEAQGLQRTNTMKRELLRIVGESDVKFAAAGIDVGTGVAADARADAQYRAAQEISIDRSTTEARAAMLRSQALGYRQLAKRAKRNSLFGALSTGFASVAKAATRLGEQSSEG